MAMLAFLLLVGVTVVQGGCSCQCTSGGKTFQGNADPDPCPGNPASSNVQQCVDACRKTSDACPKAGDAGTIQAIGCGGIRQSAKGEDGAPCFARDTFALSAAGEPVPMAALRSGDIVLDGPSSTTRVIVNQHREATFKSALVEIEHANGKLALTPDHVLAVDGAFVPARNAARGSKLGASEVSRVVHTAGEVINPLTASGKILAQGGVLASTYPEWIAEYMLSSALVPLPLSLSNLASYLFPETTQAYYDALVEPLVTAAHPKHLKDALPAALYPAAFFTADLALAVGFVAFSIASPVAAVAVIAVVAAKTRK